jgi:tetratricopeptide (TPR) repeat protein
MTALTTLTTLTTLQAPVRARPGARLRPLIGLVVLAFVGFSAAGCGALGQSDRGGPVELARVGEYRAAADGLETMVEGGDVSPRVVESLYYSWIRQGLYAEAAARFRELSERYPTSDSLRLARARVDRRVGNYEAALARLDEIDRLSEVRYAALYERAGVLDELGRRAESAAIYEELIRGFQNLDVNGDDLLYSARAMWALEYFYDANDAFKLIARENPRNAEAFVAWGDLLAEKYNEPEAVASYEDALAIDPNMPEALIGIARVLIDDNPERSEAALDRAMEINPRLIEGFLLLAEREIDSERLDDADAYAEQALEVNPRSAYALSLLAATHFLRDEQPEFERYVAEVLGSNPRYSRLYYILAERCVSVRLYQEAVDFAREAMRTNPRDWESLSLLGRNLLRVGEIEEGFDRLEEAYANDRFNIWTVNTLTLLDSFENFDTFESEHFRVNLHREESEALEPYVTSLLEDAYRTLSAKYGFEPEPPITFEMYPDHEDFAVRTLGLPGLGALGVSFGRVVVMDSPSARAPGEFNWGSTLWHEFAHVITLEMTDHKIPRWFSEGLSVYEERKAEPGWGDDLKLEFLVAIQGDQLLPIEKLNDGFVRPTHPGQVSLSYYQASLVCDFIEERYGFEAILRMLALYRDGRPTSAVFEEALGQDLDEFDVDFFEWVEARTGSIDVEEVRSLVQSGYEAMEAGDFASAAESFRGAIDLYPEYSDEQNAYEPLARAYLEQGDTEAAIATLEQFATYSETAYGTYLELAGLLRESGDLDRADDVLRRAMFIHPLDLEGHRRYGALLLERERFAEAAREFEALLALGTPDRANTWYNLASAQYAAGETTAARRSVLRSLEIAPSFEAAQELLLNIVR